MARLVSKYMTPFAARMSSKYAERLNTSVILLHKTRESGFNYVLLRRPEKTLT